MCLAALPAIDLLLPAKPVSTALSVLMREVGLYRPTATAMVEPRSDIVTLRR